MLPPTSIPSKASDRLPSPPSPRYHARRGDRPALPAARSTGLAPPPSVRRVTTLGRDAPATRPLPAGAVRRPGTRRPGAAGQRPTAPRAGAALRRGGEFLMGLAPIRVGRGSRRGIPKTARRRGGDGLPSPPASRTLPPESQRQGTRMTDDDRAAALLHLRRAGLAKGDPVPLPLTMAAMFHLPGDPAGVPAYGRTDSPTWEALEHALAHLEDAPVAVFPSGMAAISAAFFATLRAGDRILIPADGYYTTRAPRRPLPRPPRRRRRHPADRGLRGRRVRRLPTSLRRDAVEPRPRRLRHRRGCHRGPRSGRDCRRRQHHDDALRAAPARPRRRRGGGGRHQGAEWPFRPAARPRRQPRRRADGRCARLEEARGRDPRAVRGVARPPWARDVRAALRSHVPQRRGSRPPSRRAPGGRRPALSRACRATRRTTSPPGRWRGRGS